MSMRIIMIFNLMMFIAIVAIFPTSCDKEYEHEHPTADTYISPADQVLIDIKDGNYEQSKI